MLIRIPEVKTCYVHTLYKLMGGQLVIDYVGIDSSIKEPKGLRPTSMHGYVRGRASYRGLERAHHGRSFRR